MFKYTKKTFLCSLPIMLILLLQTKIVCQENSLLKIEQDLRYLEANAIEDILKGFPLIPRDECINILRDIADIRTTTKNTLLNNVQKDCYFEPKNGDLSSILFNNNEEITLATLSVYIKHCAKLLDIKPDAVCCAIPTAEQAAYSSKDSNAFVMSKDFLKEDTLTIYFNLDHLNKQQSVFHVVLATIVHELIHGIEAHPVVDAILINNIRKYYPEQYYTEDLLANPLFVALQKSQELIADVAPKMFFPQLALLETNRHFFHTWRAINCECSDNVHPTIYEMKIWNEKIIKYHKNINFYDKLIFAFKVPQTKYLLIKEAAKYSVAASFGMLLGAIGKNIPSNQV